MSDCSCVYTGEDEVEGYVLRDKIVKARKQHTCTECGEMINKGDKYESVVVVCFGEFSSCKTCKTCFNVRKEFFCEAWIPGEVWRYVSEHIWDNRGNISSDCLVSLSKPARDKVCDLIEEYWENNPEN